MSGQCITLSLKDGVSGWACPCGSQSLSLLRGQSNPDGGFAVIRCGCGQTYKITCERQS